MIWQQTRAQCTSEPVFAIGIDAMSAYGGRCSPLCRMYFGYNVHSQGQDDL